MMLQKRVLALKYCMCDRLRYLSHHETMSMMQRAFVRSGIELCYSEGFNPRPKISVVLPRSVGVESSEELICASVRFDDESDESGFANRINSQLPHGCEIVDAEIADGGASFQCISVEYVLSFKDHAFVEGIRKNVEKLNEALAEGVAVTVDRQINAKGHIRKKDVGEFISSVDCAGNCMFARCKIKPTGTVRVDEILQLLDVSRADLCGPVTRKAVQYMRTDKN